MYPFFNGYGRETTPNFAVNKHKKTEYFFNIEILCNIDDYCILFTFICGWYFFNTTGVDLNLQFPARLGTS